jgi:TonB family protein
MGKWTGFGMVALLLCSCANQSASLRPAPPSAGEEPGATEGAVPPEKMEEIQSILSRKSQDVAHCWTEEAQRTHNRELVIDMMLKLVIAPTGKAGNVEIVKNSIHSAEFDQCVIAMVRNFDFPTIPQAIELTWPYTFKPLY